MGRVPRHVSPVRLTLGGTVLGPARGRGPASDGHPRNRPPAARASRRARRGLDKGPMGAAVTAPADRLPPLPHAAIEADRAIDALRAAARAAADAEAAAEAGDLDAALAALRSASADIDAARQLLGYARMALRRALSAAGDLRSGGAGR